MAIITMSTVSPQGTTVTTTWCHLQASSPPQQLCHLRGSTGDHYDCTTSECSATTMPILSGAPRGPPPYWMTSLFHFTWKEKGKTNKNWMYTQFSMSCKLQIMHNFCIKIQVVFQSQHWTLNVVSVEDWISQFCTLNLQCNPQLVFNSVRNPLSSTDLTFIFLAKIGFLIDFQWGSYQHS